MTNSYQEFLIAQKQNPLNKVLGFTLVGLAVLSVVSALFCKPLFLYRYCGLCCAFLCAVFQKNGGQLIYYIYKELPGRQDFIFIIRENKMKVDVFDLNKAEIVAPEKSYHLDNYSKRDVQVSDYSTDEEDTEEIKNYVMYYEGKKKNPLFL